MHAEAGCATISDKNGQLQFYTNGKQVWNRQHQLMQNGTGLNGSEILNQNSIIVPHPDSSEIYYLFTINAYYDSVGLNYSVVDMQQNGGLGDVKIKNQLLQKGLVEKITGARHCNGEDIWIVGHDRYDGYYSFLLNDDGLHKMPVVSTTGNSIKSDIGYIKLSPASNRIAMPINNNNLLVELCRFHNRSGTVYDPVRIFARDSSVYAYGIEYSNDGSKLYISTGGKQYKLWQYDITLPSETEINQSATLIASGNHFAMQLALDGKIYIAKANRNYLSIIQSPGKKGLACNYREYEIYLDGGISLMGLPNFLPWFFYNPQIELEGACLGDTTVFSFSQYLNSDSLLWNFGDGTRKTTAPSKKNVEHIYQQSGIYLSELFAYHCGIADTIIKTVTINDPPIANLGKDTIICNSCSIMLDGGEGMDYWIWQDGSESQYLQVWDEGYYEVVVWKKGCEASDDVYISKGGVNVFMPNAFTPNGDGTNDVFKPVTSEPLSDYRLIIFNRTGNLLFESPSSETGWDGTFSGSPVEKGVYCWKLVYTVNSKL
jgi:gliding motility-associated-like protein